MKPSFHPPVSLAELEEAHRKVAVLVTRNDAYVRIFARLEAELVIARAQNDPVAKARAIVERQRAIA